MSRSTEIDEERAYRAWIAEGLRIEADRALLADLVRYVRARAARCTFCPAFAFWRHCAGRAGEAGHRAELLLCDAHRRAGCVAIDGADVLRRVVAVSS